MSSPDKEDPPHSGQTTEFQGLFALSLVTPRHRDRCRTPIETKLRESNIINVRKRNKQSIYQSIFLARFEGRK